MTDDERREALEAIADEVRACTACRLHSGRRRAVPGEGSPDTEVVFVGEGPGANEDEQGRPFVGAAGGLLTELIRSIGWRRDDVFITNVVKCRPPGNRDPEPDEIAACSGYLRRQLQVLDPALIVTLGRFSLQSFMPGARISSAHGTVRPVDPATGAADASVMALYHPAAAFRQAALKDTLFEDIAGAPEALLRSRERRSGDRGGGAPTGSNSGAATASSPSAADMSTEPRQPSAAETMDPMETILPSEPAPPADASAALHAGASETPPEASPDPVPAPLGAVSMPPGAVSATSEAVPASPVDVPEPALVAADDPNQMRFF